MAAFIQWFSGWRKLRDAKYHVCAVSHRCTFDVQVPAMAARLIEFGDDSVFRGLDAESSDDGLLPGGVGSRLDEGGSRFRMGGAGLSVNVAGRRFDFGSSESGWKLEFQSGKYLIRRELRRQRWCRPGAGVRQVRWPVRATARWLSRGHEGKFELGALGTKTRRLESKCTLYRIAARQPGSKQGASGKDDANNASVACPLYFPDRRPDRQPLLRRRAAAVAAE